MDGLRGRYSFTIANDPGRKSLPVSDLTVSHDVNEDSPKIVENPNFNQIRASS